MPPVIEAFMAARELPNQRVTELLPAQPLSGQRQLPDSRVKGQLPAAVPAVRPEPAQRRDEQRREIRLQVPNRHVPPRHPPPGQVHLRHARHVAVPDENLGIAERHPAGMPFCDSPLVKA